MRCDHQMVVYLFQPRHFDVVLENRQRTRSDFYHGLVRRVIADDLSFLQQVHQLHRDGQPFAFATLGLIAFQPHGSVFSTQFLRGFYIGASCFYASPTASRIGFSWQGVPEEVSDV